MLLQCIPLMLSQQRSRNEFVYESVRFADMQNSQSAHAALCSNMSLQLATAFWLNVHIAAQHRGLAAAHEVWGDAMFLLLCFFSDALQLSSEVFLVYWVQDQVGRAATEEALAVALSQLQQHQAEAQAHQVAPHLFVA